jgi:hypothetical protein
MFAPFTLPGMKEWPHQDDHGELCHAGGGAVWRGVMQQ